uniref:Uncharacterized protein n=1 Tax=Knipowitschia caucasica TaxID=637954 RepID=A0AAV2KUN0_KNICA
MDDSFRAISSFRTHTIIWAFGVEPGYNNMGSGLPVVTQFPSLSPPVVTHQHPLSRRGLHFVDFSSALGPTSSDWAESP